MAGGAPSQLPLATTKNPPPTLVSCFCVFAAMGVTSTKFGRLEVILSLSGKRGGKSHLGTILLSAFRNLKILHGHPFVAAYVFGDNA